MMARQQPLPTWFHPRVWLCVMVLWSLLCWIVVPSTWAVWACVGLSVLHTAHVLLARRQHRHLVQLIHDEAQLRGMLASSAHNIKHPVASALTILADLAQTAGLSDQQRLLILDSLAPKLDTNLAVLDTRMRQLLEIARTGIIPQPVETLTTHTLATRIETMIAREHRGSRPPLQARVWVDGPAMELETIPMLIEGVIENLVNNAHAAQCTRAVAMVEVRLVPTDDALRIHVVDAGPGFPAAMLTGDMTQHEGAAGFGSGLGLLGVQYVLRQLRGHMLLANHPERGAQVTVVVPRRMARRGCLLPDLL